MRRLGKVPFLAGSLSSGRWSVLRGKYWLISLMSPSRGNMKTLIKALAVGEQSADLPVPRRIDRLIELGVTEQD